MLFHPELKKKRPLRKKKLQNSSNTYLMARASTKGFYQTRIGQTQIQHAQENLFSQEGKLTIKFMTS